MLFGKYINKYYLKYLYMYLLGAFFLIFVNIIQLKVPEIVSGLTKAHDNGLLTNTLITDSSIQIVIIALGMFVGRCLWRIFIFNGAYLITYNFRKDLFDKSLILTNKYYSTHKVGSIMSYYTNDIDTINETIGFGFVMLIDATVLGALTFEKMLKVNQTLTLICLVPIIILAVGSYFIDKKFTVIYEARQNAFEKMSAFTQEIFSGIRVIKSFVRERVMGKRFSEVNKNTYDKDIEMVKWSALLDSSVNLLVEAMVVIGLTIGGYFVIRNFQGYLNFSMERNEIVEFTMYFNTIIWPIMAIGQVIASISRGKTSLRRISKFLDTEVDVKDNDPEDVDHLYGKISFKNFSFQYSDSEVKSLKNINLEIKPGELIGIVGKIGSGKSTFTKCLLRLDNVTPGTLFLDDIDIMKLKLQTIRENIAYVPQDNFLFSTDVESNIAFSNKDSEIEEIVDAAIFANVHDNIIQFNDGYHTLVGEKGVSLSGGQKQRIAIARAFLKKSPIMILDDSVSAVDVKTEKEILKNIREKRQNLTTIIVASRISTVESLDRVIVFNDGEIEAFDTPQNLLNISPTYQTMARLQKLQEELGGEAHGN